MAMSISAFSQSGILPVIIAPIPKAINSAPVRRNQKTFLNRVALLTSILSHLSSVETLQILQFHIAADLQLDLYIRLRILDYS